MPEGTKTLVRTATHWGAYEAEVVDGKVVALHPFAEDPDPAPFGRSMAEAVVAPCRISQPMIRQGWLKNGPQAGDAGRGAEPFVAVSWDKALDLLARDLTRIRRDHGNKAIFAGSYGWASAGRFNHAQSQVHRFMNMFGGYTKSVNSYSLAAAEVIVTRVVGSFAETFANFTAWPVIAKHTTLLVMFGGMPEKNAQVGAGGIGRHTARGWMRECATAGVKFVNIGPVKGDAADFLNAEWIAPRPNTDVALMLGLAHTLVSEGLHDTAFLARYAEGFERFRPYLMGETDGQPKDAAWAASITGLDAPTITALARRMAKNRTLLTASWSLQRGDHGEQTYWMLITLAAILGQIGLEGGGFGFGYGAVNSTGNPVRRLTGVRLNQGENPVTDFIPVARISDLLLNPGGTIDYNGKQITFPDIKMVYWAGGNPFHHHQDINRLLAAWRRPETVVVHEPFWNALAKHADIVLPATTTLERNDIASSASDNFMFAIHQAMKPFGQSRHDYEIFSGLAAHLGFKERFTEGRTEAEWLRHMYDTFRQQVAEQRVELPSFDEFWKTGHVEYPAIDEPPVLLKAFRADPVAQKLATPSGRLEIYSETIAGFGYDDCPGHPTWMEPVEWLGAARAKQFPLHMTSNQPRTKLHSQLDHGPVSIESKIQGREPVMIHPADAAARAIADGDVVRMFNDRGACLAGAVISDGVARGVVQIATGAWYDPLTPGEIGTLDKHGNPNMLTPDKGTSRLAQGPIAHSALVEIEKWQGPLPPITAFTPPAIVADA